MDTEEYYGGTYPSPDEYEEENEFEEDEYDEDAYMEQYYEDRYESNEEE